MQKYGTQKMQKMQVSYYDVFLNIKLKEKVENLILNLAFSLCTYCFVQGITYDILPFIQCEKQKCNIPALQKFIFGDINLAAAEQQ